MLSLENISLTLGKDTKLEREIFRDLNLKVTEGEFVVVIGGNGAGKSTMMNLISGALKPDQGTVTLQGREVTRWPQTKSSRLVSLVMQDPRVGTMERMSIFENMTFALKRGTKRTLIPFTNSQRKKLFQEKLSLLGMGLENRLDELVTNLSGGQRQALSLIMAIVADSAILLLDEITAALDPKLAQNVMQIADRLVRQEKRTCVMITHNMIHALEYGDRTLLLADGKFVSEFNHEEKKKLSPLNLAALFHEV